METDFHFRSVEAVSKAYTARPVTVPTRAETRAAAEDEVALENTKALQTALEETPFIRAEVVKRAAELVGDVNYPPPETMRMISHLLAIKLQSDGEQN